MNKRYLRIKSEINKKLLPSTLIIRDDSELHANHGNVKKDEKETHFYIRIVSSAFKNKSKIVMHKLVYEILNDEFSNGLHSVELELSDTE